MLVGGIAGRSIFSFMDEFSDYNQVKMDPCDAGKTVFSISIDNFNHIVMPFGLKNTSTTY